MNKLLRLLSLALLLTVAQSLNAQCTYSILLEDSFGDGWNGGVLTVTNGGNTNTFTLNNFTDDGIDSIVTFAVTAGLPLQLSWIPGFFDDEVSFSMFNGDGSLVYASGNLPLAPNLIYATTAQCPSCLKPANFFAENVYDTRAKLRWTPLAPSPTVGWWVIYGPAGFVPGPGVGDTVYVTTPKATITGLQEKTAYDVYLRQDCGGGDVSQLVGPVSFLTYFTNDVGIGKVLTPLSGCELGVETITIALSNFGSAPQSLVPFRFTVNGVDGGVPQPQDGFYTGVLGKDSSDVIEFETTYDFSEPGEYLIQVFTEMGGDEDRSNDTLTYFLVGRQVAPYAQDFENWDGGWHVDTTLSENPSWEFGTPDNTFINSAASGQNAWVTNLDGAYNSNEVSYLNSPCFDFSDLTEDPIIQFSLIHNTELNYDGLYLELSVDGGETWEKVGAVDEGQNWYNFFNVILDLGDVWAGDSDGWVTARNSLFGVAGESDVRLRFAFAADPSVQFEGIGIDDIRIYVPLANDLSATSISTAGDNVDCGLEEDEVTFSFTNFGTEPQGFFQVAYSVNGGTPIIENVGATVVAPSETFNYTFGIPFDSRDGVFEVKCWTLLADEEDPSNDTTTYTIDHRPLPVPLYEDFEGLNFALPQDWDLVSGFANITDAHNNSSFVLATNLWSGNASVDYRTGRHGIISAGDALRFDYRMSDYSLGTVATVLTPGNEVKVQVTTDCGENFQTVYTINSTTHTPTVGMQSVNVPLDAYVGQAIVVRFLGTWVSSTPSLDYFFDLDNVNIRACAPDMDLSATVAPSTNGQNGSATVNVGLGNPPYSYLWSTGATTQTISGLAVNSYTVTVTDDFGCTDALTVNVGTVSADDIEGLQALNLQPNPSSGMAWLQASFERPVDVRAELLNLLGQQVWESNHSNTTNLSEHLNLTALPDGLYLVRLSVEGKTATRKLVKSRP
jgi:hypothetical protein